MKKEGSLRVVFMGTPDFAVASLRALQESGIQIVAVVTATDKYGGRGRKKLIESAVKRYAVAQDIPVIQPKNLKSESFLEELASYKADLQVVVAFRMLPEVVWNMPQKGTINLHASYLPNYRGAAPINWAVINGEKETGVTIFKLKHAIDTGDLIIRKKVPIAPDETAGSLHDKLMNEGAQLLTEAVLMIENDTVSYSPQDLSGEYPKAPKIYTETAAIDFSKSAQEIDCFIRGLSPYPGAWFSIDGQIIKVFSADYTIGGEEPTGQIRQEGLNLFMKCKDGWIQPIEVKPSGKRKMNTKDWLNGATIEATYIDITWLSE
jgi:methionyl-tRNA formyltransferase